MGKTVNSNLQAAGRAGREPKEDPPSQHVERESAPLRECTEAALQRYFADLNGCKTGRLYSMVLREVEQPLLKTVMEHTCGNQSQAAKILGLTRSTLRKKLRSYGLNT